MNRSELRLVVGVVLAVVVPAAVLHLTAGDDRLAAGLSAAPFGWRRVLLAHLAGAVPLGLIVAGWFHRAYPRAARWPWALAAVGVTAVAAVVLPAVSAAAVAADPGPVPLLLLRSALALVLVLPWCVAAASPPAEPHRPAPPGLVFGVGLGLAIIPCGLYAFAVTDALTREAAALINQGRLARAEGVVTGLCELGSERPVGTRSPAEVRKWLAGSLDRLRAEAARPLAPSALPAARLDRAGVLVRLDRLDEAAAILLPLAPADESAALTLAAVYTNQGRGAESDGLYAGLLDRAIPRAGTDPAARAVCRTALDGLAENARAGRRPADAEAVLTRGLRELPADAAYFHFRLGQHHHAAGQFRQALEHFREVIRLDSAGLGKSAEEFVRQLRTSTPGCFLGR